MPHARPCRQVTPQRRLAWPVVSRGLKAQNFQTNTTDGEATAARPRVGAQVPRGDACAARRRSPSAVGGRQSPSSRACARSGTGAGGAVLRPRCARLGHRNRALPRGPAWHHMWASAGHDARALRPGVSGATVRTTPATSHRRCMARANAVSQRAVCSTNHPRYPKRGRQLEGAVSPLRHCRGARSTQRDARAGSLAQPLRGGQGDDKLGKFNKNPLIV